MARVEIKNEASTTYESGWSLCFQECIYHYDDGTSDNGFRFIWRRPNGNLQAARGQARIPDKKEMDKLLRKATGAGWFK